MTHLQLHQVRQANVWGRRDELEILVTQHNRKLFPAPGKNNGCVQLHVVIQGSMSLEAYPRAAHSSPDHLALDDLSTHRGKESVDGKLLKSL